MPIQSVSKFTALRYPSNVGTKDVPVYVRFTPQQVMYGKTTGFRPAANIPANLTRGLNIGLGGVGTNPLQQIQQQVGGLVDNISLAATQTLAQVQNIFQAGDIGSALNAVGNLVNGRIQIGNSTISFGAGTEQDRLLSQGSITLYMPDDISNNVGASYAAEQIGATGQEVAKGVERLQSKGDKVEQLGQTVGGVAKGAFTDLFASSGKLQALTAITQGKVVNPFSYQIFNGVQHRTFDYTFNLVAKNSADSKVIKAICDMFLYWMLPAKSQSEDFHFFDIPCQWKIEYQRLGNDIEFIQQPASSFLKNVSAKYNTAGGNNHTHTDGAPINVELSLSFVEIEPLYRAKAAELENMQSNQLVNTNERSGTTNGRG